MGSGLAGVRLPVGRRWSSLVLAGLFTSEIPGRTRDFSPLVPAKSVEAEQETFGVQGHVGHPSLQDS